MSRKTLCLLFTALALLLGACGEAANEQTEASAAAPVSSEAAASSVTETSGEEENEPAAPEGPDIKSEYDENGVYITAPITQAYRSGDTSALSKYQLVIYNRACEVLSETITDSMTDYEKELAVHDWIIKNVTYDLKELSAFSKRGENSDNPLGALVEGECICLGYTVTFNMFMDMLDIPCKFIRATDREGEDHAWSMVQIEDSWYYVDVTWDDPVPDNGGPVRHKYFNVTEDFMAIKHKWDPSALPKADSYENSFIAHNIENITAWEELVPLAEKARAEDNECFYVIPDPALDIDLTEPDEIDKTLAAGSLSKELADFYNENKGVIGSRLQFRRVGYEGGTVLAVYLVE